MATVAAEDGDAGRNAKVSYSLEPENPYVAVLKNSGVLILKSLADDRLAKKPLELRVVARDHGIPPMESAARVVLSATGGGGFSSKPSFTREKYEFSVKENSPAGTVVGRAAASKGEVSYSLSQDGGGLFAVDESTGSISTRVRLDRESAPVHELVVEAWGKDRRRRLRRPGAARAVVVVRVEDENDQAPRLVFPPDGTFIVRGDDAPGTSLGKIEAEDYDSEAGGEVSFQLLGMTYLLQIGELEPQKSLTFYPDSQAPVRISEDGEVTLIRSLRGTGQHQFPVLLVDGGDPPLTTKETIHLLAMEEGQNSIPHTVSVSARKLSVGRTAEAGTKIGSVAPAKLHHGQHFYKILPASSAERFVALNAMTGELFVAEELAGLQKIPLEFEVEVTSVSGQSPPSLVKVTVDVGDENGSDGGSPPMFSQDPITVQVDEGVEAGTTVVNLRKYSAEGAPRVESFQVSSQHPKEGAFDVSPAGVLRVVKGLDYEEHSRHLVTVRGLTQDGRRSADITVVVNVTDANDNVPAILLTQRNLAFSSASSLSPAPLYTFLVMDPDSGDAGEVGLELVSGNDGTFELDQKSHQLSLRKPPTNEIYRLLVRATDKGSPPLYSEEEVTISFRHSEGSSGLFRQSVYRAKTQENAPPELRVVTVGLKDDLRDGNVFKLMKGSEFFQINERTGEIRTRVSLDRESEDEHALVVGLVNPRDGRTTDTAVVYVTVDDVNDNAPRFGPQTCRDISVRENSPNTYVHAFVAEDPDLGENGRISYSLAGSGEGEEVARLFRIERDTGKLHALPLDREEREEYKLEVVAIDHGPERLTTRCVIRVRVEDENDNDPSFTQSIYSASVREDIPVGTEVAKVTATDADRGENGRVRYSLENATEWAFAIDERTGAVYTIRPLDREEVPEMRFDVLASDGGSSSVRSSRTRVKIIVTDANDHTPEFVSLPFRVNMSATPPAGVPLMRLLALDPDAGPNGHLTYNIVEPGQRERFHLSPEEGLLTVASSSSGDVAWEPGTIETLEVAVSDAGSPPRSSTGLVQILIEGGPAVSLKFQQASYEETVPENPLSGRDVMQVRAVRSDGRRQRVIYSFLRGNELGAFEINSNNGLIRVRDPGLVDFEKQEQFNLTVSARGLGDDSLTAYTTCTIKVRDVNDNAPKFIREVYNVRVAEGGEKGSKVVQTKAVDRDRGQTDRLRYEIIDGNVDGAFAMDGNGDSPGAILTNTVLDREIRDTYELTVSATDPGSPSLVGLAQVLVRVIDANDNRPHFAPVHPVRVPAGARPGTAVATLRANDIDLAPGGVSYRLAVPNEYLTVDVSTGQVILLKKPDSPAGSFKISVIASDTKHETSVEVEVSFDNGPRGRRCGPMLSKPIFHLLVSEEEAFPATAGNVDVATCQDEEAAEHDVLFEVPRKDQVLHSLAGCLKLKNIFTNRTAP